MIFKLRADARLDGVMAGVVDARREFIDEDFASVSQKHFDAHGADGLDGFDGAAGGARILSVEAVVGETVDEHGPGAGEDHAEDDDGKLGGEARPRFGDRAGEECAEEGEGKGEDGVGELDVGCGEGELGGKGEGLGG